MVPVRAEVRIYDRRAFNGGRTYGYLGEGFQCSLLPGIVNKSLAFLCAFKMSSRATPRLTRTGTAIIEVMGKALKETGRSVIRHDTLVVQLQAAESRRGHSSWRSVQLGLRPGFGQSFIPACVLGRLGSQAGSGCAQFLFELSDFPFQALRIRQRWCSVEDLSIRAQDHLQMVDFRY